MAQQNKLLFKTRIKRFFAKFNPVNWQWVRRLPPEAKAFLALMLVGYLFLVVGVSLITYAILEFLVVGMTVEIAAIAATGATTILYAIYSVVQSLRI